MNINNTEISSCENNIYTPKCNNLLMELEEKENDELRKKPENGEMNGIYPTLNDPNFNMIISSKKLTPHLRIHSRNKG